MFNIIFTSSQLMLYWKNHEFLVSVSASAIEGTLVFVCTIGIVEKCFPCGPVRKEDPGSWATVHCTTGMIEGNQVRLINYYGTLSLCEVEVYGGELGELAFDCTAQYSFEFLKTSDSIAVYFWFYKKTFFDLKRKTMFYSLNSVPFARNCLNLKNNSLRCKSAFLKPSNQTN